MKKTTNKPKSTIFFVALFGAISVNCDVFATDVTARVIPNALKLSIYRSMMLAAGVGGVKVLRCITEIIIFPILVCLL